MLYFAMVNQCPDSSWLTKQLHFIITTLLCIIIPAFIDNSRYPLYQSSLFSSDIIP